MLHHLAQCRLEDVVCWAMVMMMMMVRSRATCNRNRRHADRTLAKDDLLLLPAYNGERFDAAPDDDLGRRVPLDGFARPGIRRSVLGLVWGFCRKRGVLL